MTLVCWILICIEQTARTPVIRSDSLVWRRSFGSYFKAGSHCLKLEMIRSCVYTVCTVCTAHWWTTLLRNLVYMNFTWWIDLHIILLKLHTTNEPRCTKPFSHGWHARFDRTIPDNSASLQTETISQFYIITIPVCTHKTWIRNNAHTHSEKIEKEKKNRKTNFT